MNHEATKITKKKEARRSDKNGVVDVFRNPTVIASFSTFSHFFVAFVPSWLKSLRCRINYPL